jgi:hypothetical protein
MSIPVSGWDTAMTPEKKEEKKKKKEDKRQLRMKVMQS